MHDEGVGERGVGEGDEQKLDTGTGSSDAEPARGAAPGCEGHRRLDEAHAECEDQGEMA